MAPKQDAATGSESSPHSAQAGRSKPPKMPSEARLWRRALFYLQRFATTRAHLREVLLRRALREARALELDAEEVTARVERVVARAMAAGLVDDSVFALARARRLVERGCSLRTVRMRLREKGVAPELVETVLEELAEEFGDPALEAARAFARRRRLGPWRPPEQRQAMRARDLAAFARAGFAYDVARRVLEAEGSAEDPA